MALSDYQALVDSLVRDDAGKITTGVRDMAIELARLRYSSDRPQIKVEDVAAPGTNLLPLPVSWQSDFSKLKSLEYPIGNVPPSLLSPDDVQPYRDLTGDKFLTLTVIAAGKNVRYSYTQRHLLDAGNDTIPLGDRQAVASYAAALCLDELAAFYSGQTDATVQVVVVQQRTPAQEYANRARTLRQFYFDTLGIDPKRAVAAGTVVALDPRDS